MFVARGISLYSVVCYLRSWNSAFCTKSRWSSHGWDFDHFRVFSCHVLILSYFVVRNWAQTVWNLIPALYLVQSSVVIGIKRSSLKETRSHWRFNLISVWRPSEYISLMHGMKHTKASWKPSVWIAFCVSLKVSLGSSPSVAWGVALSLHCWPCWVKCHVRLTKTLQTTKSCHTIMFVGMDFHYEKAGRDWLTQGDPLRLSRRTRMGFWRGSRGSCQIFRGKFRGCGWFQSCYGLLFSYCL